MITRIDYHCPTPVNYEGRNGVGKQIGVEVWRTGGGSPYVTLTPINSKGQPARCMLEIPVEDCAALAAILLQISVPKIEAADQ